MILLLLWIIWCVVDLPGVKLHWVGDNLYSGVHSRRLLRIFHKNYMLKDMSLHVSVWKGFFSGWRSLIASSNSRSIIILFKSLMQSDYHGMCSLFLREQLLLSNDRDEKCRNEERTASIFWLKYISGNCEHL